MMSTQWQIWTYVFLGLTVSCWISCGSKTIKTRDQKEPAQAAADSLKIDSTLWASFPKNWVYMSRTENGYVVYDPCDGSTPTVDFDSLQIKICTRIEEPIICKMGKFRKLNEGQVQTESEDRKCTVKMRLVKPELNLWLFEWSITWPPMAGGTENYRWVMTTKENSKKFPVIKNPCPTQKIQEKEFLPDEF